MRPLERNKKRNCKRRRKNNSPPPAFPNNDDKKASVFCVHFLSSVFCLSSFFFFFVFKSYLAQVKPISGKSVREKSIFVTLLCQHFLYLSLIFLYFPLFYLLRICIIVGNPIFFVNFDFSLPFPFEKFSIRTIQKRKWNVFFLCICI